MARTALASFLAVVFNRRSTWEWRHAAGADLGWTAGERCTEMDHHRLRWILELDFIPKAALRITADTFDFWVGTADELSSAVPDYEQDDEVTIRTNLAGWHTQMRPVSASRVGTRRN
ncbi:hypothetical protein ACFROC_10110 [Nocardia tengchongensis]|uniref:hypothetical protein n=1 Tax=Nocardia tengchongensis TaxID=2055889 RepID=UPI0036CE462D